jgi:hypothetical protein
MPAEVATGTNLRPNSYALTGWSSVFLFLQQMFSSMDGWAHIVLELLSGNRLPEDLAIFISDFSIPFHSIQDIARQAECGPPVPSTCRRSSRGGHPVRVTGAKNAVFGNQKLVSRSLVFGMPTTQTWWTTNRYQLRTFIVGSCIASVYVSISSGMGYWDPFLRSESSPAANMSP